MLFRKKDGTIIEIKRYDYKNDIIYYQKIMELYNENSLNLNNSSWMNDEKEFENKKRSSIDKILNKI